MKRIDKASLILNGMSREECAAFFELMQRAEEWREIMVRRNAPAAGYPPDDTDGSKHWARGSNHNHNLVRAVDAARKIIGSAQ